MSSIRRYLLVAAVFCGASVLGPGNFARAETPNLFNWTGFYIGGNLGGGVHHFDIGGGHTTFDVAQQFYSTLEPTEIGVTETGNAMFDIEGSSQDIGTWFGGGQFGYDAQFGHFVLGFEGFFDRTGGHASTTTTGTATTFIATGGEGPQTLGETTFFSNRYAETNWTGGGVLHLGYAQGNWLVYLLGGFAASDVTVWQNDRATTDFFNRNNDDQGPLIANRPVSPFQVQGFTNFIGTVNTTTFSHDDDVLVGWLAGIGFKLAVAEAVSLGIEYRHLDYDDSDFHFHQGPQDFPGHTNVGLSSDQVTFRMDILLSHLFAGSTGGVSMSKIVPFRNPFLSGEDIAVAYHGQTLREGKDVMSGKDKNVQLEPVAEPFSWTGFYIGGNVGGMTGEYDFHRFTTDVDIAAQFFAGLTPPPQFSVLDVPGRSSQNDDSIIGGGQIGYQRQFGAFVIGFEGDFDGLDAGRSRRFDSTVVQGVTPTIDLAVTNFEVRQNVDQNWNASARVRLGWARGPVLLYATAGAAFTDTDLRTDIIASTDFFAFGQFFNFNTTNRSRSHSEDVETGWTAGGGAEWAFCRHASMALEYRHSGFDDVTDSSRLLAPVGATTRRVDLNNDQVTLRVNWLLGHGR